MWKLPYMVRRYDTPATYAMLAIMAIVFFFDFITQNQLLRILEWFPSVDWLRTGPYWQPFTFPFAHGGTNFFGILADALVLYFFGGSLERAWGTNKFLFFFFSSGIIVGLVLMPSTMASPFVPHFFGMAGSFVAIVVAFASMNPFATIIFYFFPMQARWMALIIVGFELFGMSFRYGGPLQSIIAVATASIYAYLFATRRIVLPTPPVGKGPSMRERFDRWQQRRRMRQWQRRVSKIDRPEDLFKDK